MAQRTFIFAGSIALIIAAIILSTRIRSNPFDVSLCLPVSPASGLPLIAEEKGFFKNRGLTVQIQFEKSGGECVEKLQHHQVDFAASCSFPLTNAISGGAPLVVLTELANSNRNMTLVIAPTAPPSTSQRDAFKNKKVALLQKSNAETFLRLYAKAHDLEQTEYSVVSAPSLTEVGELLLKGQVDAAIMTEPFLSVFLNSHMPHKFRTERSDFFSQFNVLSSTEKMSSEHPEIVQNLILALFDSQKFNELEPVKAQEIMTSRLHYKASDLGPEMWDKFQLKVGLSAVLISMMKQSQVSFYPNQSEANIENSTMIMRSMYPQGLRKIAHGLVTYE